MRQHNNTTFECARCLQIYACARDYKKHMAAEHGETRCFKCPEPDCSYKAARVSSHVVGCAVCLVYSAVDGRCVSGHGRRSMNGYYVNGYSVNGYDAIGVNRCSISGRSVVSVVFLM